MVFLFFIGFTVLGLAALHVRRRDDREFDRLSETIASEQARFWKRRMQADAADRAGDGEAAERYRAACARHLVRVRGQVAELRAGYPRQSAAVGLDGSYGDAELRRMADAMAQERLSEFDARAVREQLAGGPGALRPPVPRDGFDPFAFAVHFVAGAAAGGLLGLGAALFPARYGPHGAAGQWPLYAAAGALAGGVLAGLARDAFWEKLAQWYDRRPQLWP